MVSLLYHFTTKLTWAWYGLRCGSSIVCSQVSLKLESCLHMFTTLITGEWVSSDVNRLDVSPDIKSVTLFAS